MNQTTDEDMKDMLEDICYKYIGPVLCVFGIVGNIINLIVLSRQQLVESPYIYLKALAVTDMSALLFSFPFMVVSREATTFPLKWYNAYVFLPVVNFFTASSIWITVVMTIDRFIFVKFPIWARWRCSRFSAQVRVWIILFATVLISVPRLFCYKVVPIVVDNANVTVTDLHGYRIKSTEFRLSEHYQIMNIALIILIHFLPLIILCVINIYLIIAVQQARIAREELNLRNNMETEWQKDQRRFTITLISIVLLAIVSILPAAICDIMVEMRFGLKYSKLMQIIANLLMWLNLSMNFIMYCAFNKKFVRVLKDVMGRSIYRFRYSLKSVGGQSEMTTM
ncbi:probable G-protein coupled receptor B0563.6 [Ylistrum balloti]|uniref:probable G-protein coupled receptor B0563.6 n=1 Tax=Ylistrum balloti TaxID=509963 RepID=UPI0029058A9B|nr:probable G-protein coupled receptor B0563.6 [Ylistrum balloti]